MVPNCVPVSEQEMEEDLKKWFREKWVRFGPDGKIRGDCARGSEGEGKPKCLPQAKAHALGKKGRASAAAKKRREDPNPERRGPAKNVATKVKEQYTDNDDWYDDEDQETELRSGDYVRDRLDGEYGEVFKMVGDPNERRVQILDRDGRGWYITTDRLVAVGSDDPSIQRYFGKKRQRDMDEAIGDKTVKKLQALFKQAKAGKLKSDGRKPGDSWTGPKPGEGAHAAGHGMTADSMKKQQDLDEKQDACYRKVKSRYKVWPSAYASGALVQCRKKGAANWGTGAKKK